MFLSKFFLFNIMKIKLDIVAFNDRSLGDIFHIIFGKFYIFKSYFFILQ